MSARAELTRFRKRVSDKWQILTLLVAIALLIGSLLQIKPPEAGIPLDTLCDRIAVLAEKHVIVVGTMADMLQQTHPWIHAYFHGPRARAVNQEPQG